MGSCAASPGRVRRHRGRSPRQAERCRARRCGPFGRGPGGEIGILAGGPQPRAPPAHALTAEDAADLTARDLDALIPRRGGQGIERPLRLALRQPRLAARAWLHAQPIQPTRGEGTQVIPDGLRMAAEFVRDLARTQAVPAARDQLRVHDPVGGRVDTMGEFAHLAFLEPVKGESSREMLRHGAPPSPQSLRIFWAIIEERRNYLGLEGQTFRRAEGRKVYAVAIRD